MNDSIQAYKKWADGKPVFEMSDTDIWEAAWQASRQQALCKELEQELITGAQPLAELVACKDLKDRAEALHFAGPQSDFGDQWEDEYKRLRAEYTHRQPKAWDAARAAVDAAIDAEEGTK